MSFKLAFNHRSGLGEAEVAADKVLVCDRALELFNHCCLGIDLRNEGWYRTSIVSNKTIVLGFVRLGWFEEWDR